MTDDGAIDLSLSDDMPARFRSATGTCKKSTVTTSKQCRLRLSRRKPILDRR